MKIEINDTIKSIIDEIGNKTKRKNALKIYAALWSKSILSDKFGWFPISAKYMMSINKRYKSILDHFIERGLIEYKERSFDDPNDLFGSVKRKYYNTSLGITMNYRFLIDTKGYDINVDLMGNKNKRWYNILSNSLEERGYEVKIKRDVFGRRCHHPAIRNYKKDFIGFSVIDAVCSQPRLLYLELKKRKIYDKNYYDIFENGLDFYNYIMAELDLETRDDAKDLFMFWLNGDGYVPDFNIHRLFPYVSKFLKDVKRSNYKNSASLLQRIESKIWIDDIMENLPCNFGIPIHDALIVKKEDSDKVLNFCKERYDKLIFDMKEIN